MSLVGIRDLSRCCRPRPPTASRSSPSSASTTSASPSRPSAANSSARARCSGCTTGCRLDRGVRPPPPRARARGPHRDRPRPDGRGHRSNRWSSTSGRADFDVLVCTTIIESGIDMPTVNTLVVERADLLGLGQMHQLRGRVGPQRVTRLRLPVPPAGRTAHRGGLRTAPHHRRGHRPRQRLQDRDARPRDPRRRQPARREPERPHRRGRLRPLLPDGHRGRRRDEGRRRRSR